MKKILSAIFISSALLFTACAEKSDSQQTYNEADVQTEADAIDKAESQLSNLGLRFVESSGTITWNETVINKYYPTKEDFVNAADSKILPALVEYKELAQNFVRKYGQGFTLRKNDGTVQENRILLSHVKAGLNARIDLVKKTITAVQNRK